MQDLRIPFSVAITDKRLLKRRFDELSLPQQVALKALYGCELSAKIVDDRGWSELDYWSASQLGADYDDLGYIQSIGPVPYIPKKYNEGWFICGRRAGKSDALASTIVTYEATLGGHEQHVRKGQQAICFQIAQDLRMARYSLNFINATLESSPIFSKLVTAKTADRIDLKTGLTIAVVPPSLKAVRGYATPVAILDEVGVWYQDAEAANPDYEIRRAVSPAQLQFPNKMLVGISSPWNKAGLLYQYYDAGTDGKNAAESERAEYNNVLVWHGTTAGMGNPKITREYLAVEHLKDPRAFERECLALFQDSISGFLSSELLKLAVSRDAKGVGIVERAPERNNFYVAAIDPAFRRDAFALVIAHAANDGSVVVDLIRRWLPEKGHPLNPQDVFADIVPLLKSYRVNLVTSDQYHLDTLQQLALTHNFAIEGIPFTAVNKASIYGNLQQLLNQRRLHLVDHPEAIRELRSLERRLTKMGLIQIAGPPGMHDDVASAIALAAHKTSWMLPTVDKKMAAEPTVHERIAAQIARKRAPATTAWD